MRIKQWLTFVLSVSLSTSCFSAEKLIFAVDLIRHGDRTPIQAMPTINYEWKEGLGQLTATGMHQEFELGREFRRRYIETTHLLPEHFHADTMYVYASDYSRTLMSATSLLAGLYPSGTGPKLDDGSYALPNGFQPVPIHSEPDETNFLMPRPIYAKVVPLLEKFVFTQPEWQAKEKVLKPKFELWSKMTGFKIQRLEDLKLLADNIYISRLNQVTLPKELSEADCETIIETSKWIHATEESSPSMKPYYTHELTSKIADYLKTGSEKKSPLKYVLLSAHDTTIIRAITLLGGHYSKWPHYASDLNFSLFENEKGEQTVKVTLNDEAVMIPGCGGNVCTLAQFTKLAY